MFIFPYLCDNFVNTSESLLDNASLLLELALLLATLSLTTKSNNWLLSRILSGILFGTLILSSVKMLGSAAST